MNHLKLLSIGAAVMPIVTAAAVTPDEPQRPNVIFILTDDLGIGDLGCYGQRDIPTPNIDSLAAHGMQFMQHYAGSTVSAPSRCVLLTGKHTGHSYIRGNQGFTTPSGHASDYPLADAEVTAGEIFKASGYSTACVGKWGLGGIDNEGHPNNQGFDYFYGYLSQVSAHKYYPEFLYENGAKIPLDKKHYSDELIIRQAEKFIADKAAEPFFLYYTTTLPHAELTVPDDELAAFDGKFAETPFAGDWYCSQTKPRATFAAMITRIDRNVGRIVKLLKDKGIYDNTIIIFSSDNGTHLEGGHDPYFFASNSLYRGTKRDLYQGGIRTPYIVSWGDRIRSGSVSYHVSAFWDFVPTVCDILNVKSPDGIDGISLLPALTEQGEQPKHDYLYFEFHEMGGKQAIIRDNWKLIKLNAKEPLQSYLELYNLGADPKELRNVAAEFPAKALELKTLMENARTHNTVWDL